MAHRILVADDDAAILQLFRMILENAGYEVDDCSSGRDVGTKIRANRPESVILDVMLPGMDGYSIAKQMGDNTDTKEIPIIVITT